MRLLQKIEICYNKITPQQQQQQQQQQQAK
jgi:hypothetical protein